MTDERLLVVDLAARAKNWALQPEGEKRILDATPDGWRVHIVRALTSSDGDGPREPSEESLTAIAGAEVYFGFGIPRPLFLAAKKLRWAHSAAAGVGNALYAEMMQSEVVLTNSAGVHAIPIAEYVVAGILHFFRGLDIVVAQQRERRWDKSFFTAEGSPVREVGGSRMLVVGAGGIGGQVAMRLHALGARCIGIRRRLERGAPPGFDRVVGLDELDAELPDADVVVLATPLTNASRGLLNANRLRAMKRGAVVVNVARGALVDEQALVEALRSGHLRGALLDVFQEEPLASDHPLWQLPSALLSPHISPVSPGRFWPRALDVFCDNWGRYVRGEPLRNLVDKHAGY
jgi:phosphoglycerate dehydrogenase-like enzyme